MPPRSHRPITEATAKELYAHAISCGHPQCNEPLYRDEGSGVRALNSRIAHICARSEGGPRWNPDMPEAENRSASNLVVLCISHADLVDQKQLVAQYPVELLLQWKQAQLDEYTRVVETGRVAGWALTDDEAAEVVEKSERSTTINLTAETIIVGGMGGHLGGAGGGGGVIGSDAATGGTGGDVTINLEGQPGQFPGAGGGGGGALDYQGPWLPHTGDGTAGRAHIAGYDGGDGGDTVISIGDREILRAPGGRGARAGSGERKQTDRLHVSALLPANAVFVDNALAHILYGGWRHVDVIFTPARIEMPMLVVVEAGGVDAGEYTITIDLHSPDGELRLTASLALVIDEPGDLVRVPFQHTWDFQADQLGVWRISVRSETSTLAVYDLMIKQPDAPVASSSVKGVAT
ncbi:hypothetical protein BCL50_3623 [Mycolicibacterium litorale]|nr:hypothetical protein BCL50_3623 [Mycolicibacterium litorale]